MPPSYRTPGGLTRARVTDLSAFRQALRSVQLRVEREAAPAAAIAAAGVLRDAVRREAPKGSGFMAAQVRVVHEHAPTGVIILHVQIGEKDFVGKTFYAAMVEYGHKAGPRFERLPAGQRRSGRGLRHLKARARTEVPADPFMRRAVESHGGRADAAARAAFAARLRSILKG